MLHWLLTNFVPIVNKNIKTLLNVWHKFFQIMFRARASRKFLTGSRHSSTSATFKFEEGTFLTHNCEFSVGSATATKEELLLLFRQMVEIRRLEMACDQVNI
jgi:hypothetical protein